MNERKIITWIIILALFLLIIFLFIAGANLGITGSI